MAAVRIPHWSWIAPLAGCAALFGADTGGSFVAVLAVALAGCVLAAVHHAEVIAHKVGEPFGSLVLALAVTIIEVALIVSLMLSGGAATEALARDTIFAAVMIILNGMVGLCLLVGGMRHHEQAFGTRGVSSTLAVLAALSVLTLILPNYTTSVAGPYYSPAQLVTVAIVSLVLMPEGLAAVRAARANRLQSSLNLALGSALASIGLTIPAVAVVSLVSGWNLVLGLDAKSTVLLALSLLVATISLSTGRTTVLQGAVHLVIFSVYLVTTIVP